MGEILHTTDLQRMGMLMLYRERYAGWRVFSRYPQGDPPVREGEREEFLQAMQYAGWPVAPGAFERKTLGVRAKIKFAGGVVSATGASPMVRSSRSVQPTLRVDMDMHESVAQAIELAEELRGLVLRLETASFEEIGIALDSVGR